MFARTLQRQIKVNHFVLRNFNTTKSNNVKVAVIGASGGIGASMVLLLKTQPDLISEINMYDIAKKNPGVAMDISHINTQVKITPFTGTGEMKNALKGADIVSIPGGVPRQPGMTRDDLFTANASLIKDSAAAVAEICPNAQVHIITNPVNSCVPIFCEMMRKAGKLDPKKIFGVSTLDLLRTSTFVGNLKGLDPKKVYCPVIGGHSGETICPIISQCNPSVTFGQAELETLTKNIQEAGTHVVKAKAGAGSAQLSMSFAGARFIFNCIRGMKGESNVIECAYVLNDVLKTKYFSTQLVLGKNGVEKLLDIGKLSDYEQKLISIAVPVIKKNVAKGEKFAA